jgi:hypothetical protein
MGIPWKRQGDCSREAQQRRAVGERKCPLYAQRLSPSPFHGVPDMARQQRERQLWSLLQTQTGREVIYATYMNLTGQMPQVGMLASQMIEAILDHEFPEQK